VKWLTIALIILASLPAVALAQVQYYGIDTTLSDAGSSSVKITITFQNPINNFNFSVIGKVENFNATSIAGPINCAVTASGINFVNCEMSLTQDKRTIELYYETNDFVKNLNGKNFFDADFSINENIAKLSTTVRLPEGTALVESNIPNKLSFPQNATTLSDGRRIIVLWSLSNLSNSDELRFQILYEKISQPSFLAAWPYFVGGTVIIATVIVFVFKYIRKPEKMILSVLDEYERKVVDIISSAGGEVNQKKIVQETNLSKAKISRVIKSLVDRGVVEIERMGRANKIKLLKRKFKI
jgi:uncharacterized membrane protein